MREHRSGEGTPGDRRGDCIQALTKN